MLDCKMVMNTMFRAHNETTPKFSEALLHATHPHSSSIDGSHIDQGFNFALAKLSCDECNEDHWAVLIVQHGQPFERALGLVEVDEIRPMETFENAIVTYNELHEAANSVQH